MSKIFTYSMHRSTSKQNDMMQQLFLKGSGVLIIFFALLVAIPTRVEAANKRISDADVLSPTRKNAKFIKRKHIRTSQVMINVGNERFVINVFKKDGPNKQKYIVIHDSEDAAFDTGLRAIKHGGTLIALENKENRLLYSFGKKKGPTHQDPNRMFNTDNRYWPVAKKLLELYGISSKGLIIVLHNNKPDGDFRLDSIATWNNITIASHADKDVRSLVWIPGTTAEPNVKTGKEIAYFQKKKLNVVYEYVPQNPRGDGSLSVYAAKHGIPYRNIEVKAGIRGDRKSELKSRRKQIRYLNVLRRFHGVK